VIVAGVTVKAGVLTTSETAAAVEVAKCVSPE